MKQMNCKWCDLDIDYDPDAKVAYEQDGNKHECPKAPWKKDPNKPKGFPKKWAKKEIKPVESELVLEALKSDVEALKIQVEKDGEAIKALVKELSFKTGKEIAGEEPHI